MFACATASAHTVNYSFESLEEAKKSASFIKFEMSNTKIGFLTSSFDGFAKKFSVNYELEGAMVKTARITLSIDHLDTDSDGRNETMKTDCFNYKKFPDITILVADPIPIDGKEHSIPAIMNLRGTDKPIQVTVKAQRDGRKMTADISGIVSLKELDIPDPSILVAKIRDKVELKAHLEASE